MCVSCSGSIKPLIFLVLPSWCWRQEWGDLMQGAALATLYLDFEMFWIKENLFLSFFFFFLPRNYSVVLLSETISYLLTALVLFTHCTCISILGTGRRNGIRRKKTHFRDKIAPLLCYSCSPDNTNFLLSVSITLDVLRMELCCFYFLSFFLALGLCLD